MNSPPSHTWGELVGQREYFSLLWDAVNVEEGEKVLGMFTIFESTTDYSVEEQCRVDCLTPGCVLEVMSWPTLPICVIAACSQGALPDEVVKVLKQVRTPRPHQPLLRSPFDSEYYGPRQTPPQQLKGRGELKKRLSKTYLSRAFTCSQ